MHPFLSFLGFPSYFLSKRRVGLASQEINLKFLTLEGNANSQNTWEAPEVVVHAPRWPDAQAGPAGGVAGRLRGRVPAPGRGGHAGAAFRLQPRFKD